MLPGDPKIEMKFGADKCQKLNSLRSIVIKLVLRLKSLYLGRFLHVRAFDRVILSFDNVNHS